MNSPLSLQRWEPSRESALSREQFFVRGGRPPYSHRPIGLVQLCQNNNHLWVMKNRDVSFRRRNSQTQVVLLTVAYDSDSTWAAPSLRSKKKLSFPQHPSWRTAPSYSELHKEGAGQNSNERSSHNALTCFLLRFLVNISQQRGLLFNSLAGILSRRELYHVCLTQRHRKDFWTLKAIAFSITLSARV